MIYKNPEKASGKIILRYNFGIIKYPHSLPNVKYWKQNSFGFCDYR